ncbi:MAG: hypothetical protein KKA62_05855 [Nanoarchaeota archaeon]|nr:hypothetical protein [Nanoarchaeota archaeon]MBU1643856.1 hypothetical protein [Nanoarchaeota archaeon]MBU1977448.1 hypothetical protein [Nanoarchaeota archaeon]
MQNKLWLILVLSFLLSLLLTSFASAATLKGSIYNNMLELEENVLLEVDTTPIQKYLSKDGTYTFELPPGEYKLTTRSNDFEVVEEIKIVSEKGEYLFDVFLLPDFAEEDELWKETEESMVLEEEPTTNYWSYLLAGMIFIFAIYRIVKARKKYGPLKIFRKKIKAESNKTVEEHKQELEKEPGYLDEALEIIKKHDGRISQKELRKEMMYLSEGKISLILTELEHKGKVEKIKKGRGNVVILKVEE